MHKVTKLVCTILLCNAEKSNQFVANTLFLLIIPLPSKSIALRYITLRYVMLRYCSLRYVLLRPKEIIASSNFAHQNIFFIPCQADMKYVNRRHRYSARSVVELKTSMVKGQFMFRFTWNEVTKSICLFVCLFICCNQNSYFC